MEVLNQIEFKVTDEMLASKNKRFLNLIFDYGLFYSLFLILGFFLVIIAELTASDTLYYFLMDLDSVNPLVDRLISALLMVVFYLILESLSQKTVGKLITSVKLKLKWRKTTFRSHC